MRHPGIGWRLLPSDRTVFVATILMIVFCASLLFSQVSVDYLSWDAPQYLSVAENLLTGKGPKTTTLIYPSQLDQGLPARQTIWPPGLPLAAAAVSLGLSLDPALALGVVNIAAHTSIALLLLWTAAHFRLPPLTAAAVALGFMLYWANWSLALAGMAEPLFISMLVGVAACLIKYADSEAHRFPWLAGAAVLMATAFLIRYQTAPFVAALGAAVIAERLGKTRPFRAVLEASLTVAPALLAFGALVAHNLWAVGSLRGGPEHAGGYSPQEIAFLLLAAAHELIGGEAGLLAEVAAIVGVLALLTIIAVVFLIRRHPLRAIAGQEALLVFCLLGTALNLALVLVRTSSCCFLPARFLLPSIPLLLIAAMAFAPARKSLRDGVSRVINVLQAVCVVAFTVVLAINARYHVQWLENKAAPGRIETVLETSYRLGSLRAFLSDVSSLSSPILSNQSQDLYTVLRKPTVGAPWAWMVKEPWTAEDIRELAARFGVEYLVIFHRIGPGRDQDFVLRLLDEDPKFLAPLLVTDDVTLYRFVAP